MSQYKYLGLKENSFHAFFRKTYKSFSWKKRKQKTHLCESNLILNIFLTNLFLLLIKDYLQ